MLICEPANDRLIDTYYQERRWNASGIPMPDTLKQLGLWEFLDDITRSIVAELTESKADRWDTGNTDIRRSLTTLLRLNPALPEAFPASFYSIASAVSFIHARMGFQISVQQDHLKSSGAISER
jgi:hypothetical protein